MLRFILNKTVQTGPDDFSTAFKSVDVSMPDVESDLRGGGYGFLGIEVRDAPAAAPPVPTTDEAREGRARAAAVEALHRIKVGAFCTRIECPANLRFLALAALSGVDPLPRCEHPHQTPQSPEPY